MEFDVTPAHTGQSEYFQLLIEGKNWLPDTILQFPMPEPPPLEVLEQQSSIEATGLTFSLQVVTADRVPWTADADSDWIKLSRSASSGSDRLPVTVLPNWHSGARSGHIRIGRVEVAIEQFGCKEPTDRITLLCYWKLLGRSPSAAEFERSRRANIGAVELIETLLLSEEPTGDPRLLADRLFAAFLEQTPRPGRWRGVIRDANDRSEPMEIIKRFLALTEVQALFTPTGSSELPS
jgi:hypothetical protein